MTEPYSFERNYPMRSPPAPLRPPLTSKSVCYSQELIREQAEKEAEFMSNAIIHDEPVDTGYSGTFDVLILLASMACGAVGVLLLIKAVFS